MIRFILNEKEISTGLPPGTVLLDLIRYHQHLFGTKIGCREGDCGACTVLVGSIINDDLKYESMTSCLLPLGNVAGKHIVTIEGINMEGLNPIQQAMSDEGATQCGFCTPGFVVSLAGFCLGNKKPTKENAIAAIDGNICRCTGYKSIERAAVRVAALLEERKNEAPEKFAAGKKILPSGFSLIKERLVELNKSNMDLFPFENPKQIVGGGTDLYVQKHDEMANAVISFVVQDPGMKGIGEEGTTCILGPSVTVSELLHSSFINKIFPGFASYAKLVSSTPIRNMATLAGNFVNASPIGDFTIFFLALDATLVLSNGTSKRDLPLRQFYKAYKVLDKNSGEIIEQIKFEIPRKNSFFNFEKVSKRTNLDIASVNSAICLNMNNGIIEHAGISAGGVGPIPLYLQKTSAFLKNKPVSEALLLEVVQLAQSEISPISDARGSAEYKKLLLGQLIKAHFLKLFPVLEVESILFV